MDNLSCNYQSITIDIPHQIWEAVTTDGTGATPLLMTRALHNKPLFYLLNISRCYFHYLSPHFFSSQFGPIITFILIVTAFYIWKKQVNIWKWLRWLILIYPLLLIFEIQKIII